MLARNRNVWFGITNTTWVTKPTLHSKVKTHCDAREQQALTTHPGMMLTEVTLQCPAGKAIPQEHGPWLLLYKGLPTSTTTVGQVAKTHNATHAWEAYRLQKDAPRSQTLSIGPPYTMHTQALFSAPSTHLGCTMSRAENSNGRGLKDTTTPQQNLGEWDNTQSPQITTYAGEAAIPHRNEMH